MVSSRAREWRRKSVFRQFIADRHSDHEFEREVPGNGRMRVKKVAAGFRRSRNLAQVFFLNSA
jgi:hypothetical protein